MRYTLSGTSLVLLFVFLLSGCDTTEVETFVLSSSVIGNGQVTHNTNSDDGIITLQATAGPLWVFDRWEGDISSTENPLNHELDGDLAVTAIFSPEENVVAAYLFDGNAVDASGNENNGSVTGVVSIPDRFGIAGGALAFDGIDDNIVVGPSASLELGDSGSSYSVSFWFRSEEPSDARLLDKWNDMVGTPYPFSIRFDPSSLELEGAVYNGSTVNKIVVPNAADNKWHHFAMSVDLSASTLTVYFDGQLVAEQVVTFSEPTINSSALYIGSSLGFQTQRYFEGHLDDLYLLNRAITDADVQSIYLFGGWGS